jgi:signal transduction histidine kinase
MQNTISNAVPKNTQWRGFKPHFFGQKAQSALQGATRTIENIHPGLIAALGVIFIALEIKEHIILGQKNLPHFISEVSLVILLLGCSYWLIRVLLGALSKRDQAMEIMRWKYDLGIILSSSQDKDQVASHLVEQIHLMLPRAAVDLYLLDTKKNSFQWTAGEAADSDNLMLTNSSPTLRLPESPCRLCMAQQNRELNMLGSCRHAEVAGQVRAKNGFCLPLQQGQSSVGILHLHLPGREQLPPRQVEFLQKTSFEMANALNMAIERKNLEEAALEQKVRAIQLDIARDLHDTIGQNIGYLRLRLDRIVEQGEAAFPAAKADFTHMLEVANESYDLLRGTMAVLQSTGAEDLQALFARYAAKVSDRASIEIIFQKQIGPQPQNLPPGFVRQVFFIFREVLNNIEKHAYASQVQVEIQWGEDLFFLTVSDNGAGFDPSSIPAGHYGIRFIHNRVEALYGSVSIHSSYGEGSTIRIQAPI